MIGDIIDKITGPSPEEHLAIENAESGKPDGASIEELLPPRSKGGVHMSYMPSREHLREIMEHHGPEAVIGMEYSIHQCGTWQFVKEEDGEVVEQCDSCGEYRRLDADDTPV